MKILVDPLKLLEIPKVDENGYPIKKKFHSSLSFSEISKILLEEKEEKKKEEQKKYLSVKFITGGETFGSIYVEPNLLTLSSFLWVGFFIEDGSKRYLCTLFFNKKDNPFGDFEIEEKPN